MIKKINLFLLVLSFNILNPYSRPIIEITIPKTGTHLLATCLNLLTYREMKNLVKDFENLKELKDGSFFHAHLDYNEANIKLVRSLRPIGFFVMRDPRDQIISLMHWVYKYSHAYPQYYSLNPDQLLCQLIKDTTKLYKRFTGWMKEPNFMTIRFEDLVGLHGNGNQSKQINTILAIARHLDFFTSKNRAEYIAESIFGNSVSETFREGKIGSWKKYFTKNHKKLCKKHIGKLLIELKYEKDLNW